MADTAASLALSARRNEVARFTIAVTGIDMTGVAMAMQIRLGLDVPGAPLISLATVTTLAAEGLKLDSVTTTNGVPTSIIKGRINASTMTDATKVPYMGEIGADSVLAYAMQWTVGGDAQTRLYGDFVVVASAFGSDGAPTNRPPSYGGTQSFSARSSGGSLSFGDQIVTVTLPGVELLSPLVGRTEVAASAAEGSAVTSGNAAASSVAARDQSVTAASASAQDRLTILAGLAGHVSPIAIAVATRDQLAATNPDAAVEGTGALLGEVNRAGAMVFRQGDRSALASIDTDRGVFVPRSGDLSGATGGWLRPESVLDIEWFGVTGYDTLDAARAGFDNSSRINRAIQVAAFLGRSLYFRRFYSSAGGIVNSAGVPLLGAGKARCGIVTTTASTGQYHALKYADCSGVQLDGMSIWHRASSSGQYDGIRLERVTDFYIAADVFDNRVIGIRAVDCRDGVVEGAKLGASTRALYDAGVQPFGSVWLDSCMNCTVIRGSARYISFGYATTGDDNWRKSYFTASAATDEIVPTDPQVFANAKTGDSCILITREEGILPGGLTASPIYTYTSGGLDNPAVRTAGGTVYWIVKTATGFKLANSYSDAIANNATIDLTSDGRCGNGLTQITLTLTITGPCAVDVAADTLTVAAEFYGACATGTPVAVHQTLSGGYAAPIVSDQTYYVIKTGAANVIQLASSLANATAGTAINLTSTGANAMVLIFGPKENYSNNDHIGSRPQSDNVANTIELCTVRNNKGHPFNISTGYNNWTRRCTAIDNDEAAGSTRLAFQIKHSYGDGSDMNGHDTPTAINQKTAIGMQEGSKGIFLNPMADGVDYGMQANSSPSMIVVNPTMRNIRKLAIICRQSPGFSMPAGGTFEAAPGFTPKFALFNASGGWNIDGPVRFSGTWGAGIHADTGSSGFTLGRGYIFNGYNFIAALNGHYGHDVSASLPAGQIGVVGVRTIRTIFQVSRWTWTSIGTVDATTRVSVGRMGSPAGMIPVRQPPTGDGVRKDYMGSAFPSSISIGADLFTLPADFVAITIANTRVRVSSPTGLLPAPLVEGTDYFVVNPNTTNNTIQLAATSGGTPIDLTAAGTDVFITISGWAQTGMGLAGQVTAVGSAGQSVLIEASGCPWS